MKTTLSLSIICLSLIIFSCQKESKHLELVDENELLVKNLPKAKGNARTYNFDFKIIKNDEPQIFYYAPVKIPEALNSIPKEMRDVIHLPNINEFPFTPGTSKANIVTFWNKKNKLTFQIQISYFENKEDYKTDLKNFFIISASMHPNNPFVDNINSNKDAIDLWREEFNVLGTGEADDVVIYEELKLIDDLPLFFKGRFRNWTTMYSHYSFDKYKNEIKHTSTGSKIYYAWYKGIVFQIGYNFDNTPEIEDDIDPSNTNPNDDAMDMESVVRQIILGTL